MARVFTWQFTVRTYELDAFGHVNNAVFQRYLEEGATRASADAGLAYDWYFEQRRAWVIRTMQIKYLQPLRYGDRVALRTWVSDVHRSYSHREYELTRVDDGSLVVRGRAKWVYVDLDRMRPARIPTQFVAAFDPTGELEPLHIRLRNPNEVAVDKPFHSKRRVQHYELDPAGHVNNAVYLNWFEQAMFDAHAAVNWSFDRVRDEAGVVVFQAAHEVDYLQPTLYGMEVRIESRPVEIKQTRGAWVHELYETASGDLLARDYSVGVFLDAETHRPRSLPVSIQDALVRGSAPSD